MRAALGAMIGIAVILLGISLVKTDTRYDGQAEAPIVGQCNANGQCWTGTFWTPRPQPPKPKPPFEVKTWKLTVGNADSFQVWCIETEGVCLYNTYFASHVASVAVPKTQLKPGVGCQ